MLSREPAALSVDIFQSPLHYSIRETVIISPRSGNILWRRLLFVDLTDIEFVRLALRGAAHVINCAGEKADPAHMVESNVTVTQNLLEASKEVGLTRFMQVSSVGVIGKTRLHVIDENSPQRPMSFYLETKPQAEELVRASGLDATILRSTNVFGRETINDWIADSRRKCLIRGGETRTSSMWRMLRRPHSCPRSCDEGKRDLYLLR